MIGRGIVGRFPTGRRRAAAGGGGLTLSPATGAILVAGNTPTISQPKTVSPATGAIVLAGNAPSVSQVASISPTTGSIVLAGNVPTISQPRTLSPITGEIVLTGLQPTLSQFIANEPSFASGGGGGLGHEGYKKRKKLTFLEREDDTLKEIYEELTGEGTPKSVAKQAAAIAKPFVPGKAKAIPASSSVKWAKVAASMPAMRALEALYEQEEARKAQEDEDEDILLLSL